MAKTAAFDADGVLIDIYESGKAAKEANKGSDVTLVTEKNFPADGIGDYKTATDLFPPPAPKEPKEPAERGPRNPSSPLAGDYIVVKADGVRFAETDERGLAHKALVENTTFEDYLKAAPEKITFETSRGATQVITASNWARYALRRGWIAFGSAAAE